MISEPGVYELPEHEYHADPVAGGSLSHTGAKDLLPPSCPAKFAHRRKHGRPPKREFDLGTAAHREALGAGADLVLVDAVYHDKHERAGQLLSDYKTKAAQEIRDAAYAAGKTPVLAREMDQVREMVAALRAHPLAAALLDPGRCVFEQSVFWRDEDTGVWRRARLDAWSARFVVDYKTTTDAAPDAVARSIAKFGYYQQAAWYLDAAAAVGRPAEAFLNIFQETEPPYLVTVAEPDELSVHIGRLRNRRALEIYRDCTESGIWPGYSQDVVHTSLPRWAQAEEGIYEY